MKQPTGKQILIWSMLVTIMMETLTVVLRFGFKLKSSQETASTVGALTQGIRIHHGYIGVLMIIAAFIMIKRRPGISTWMLVFGNALFLSDLIHHFLILWPIIGTPEFDFLY